MNNVEIKNVDFSFKDHAVFKNLSLEVAEGSIIGIIGPNGIGKSVLFKLIAGLILPDKGSITVNGKDLLRRAFPDDFGALIEEPGFIGRLSGYDNLKMLSSIQGKIGDEEIDGALKTVGLWENKDVSVKNYSLGMKKKLGIAQAIMEKPRLIILDEPMNALDDQSVQKMRVLFKKLSTENNVTIIIASHNMDDINVLSDNIYKISDFNVQRI